MLANYVYHMFMISSSFDEYGTTSEAAIHFVQLRGTEGNLWSQQLLKHWEGVGKGFLGGMDECAIDVEAVGSNVIRALQERILELSL